MRSRYYLSKILLIPSILMLTFSCENQVNINLQGPPVPVAFLILDLNDSIQKIRINETFLIGSSEQNGKLENFKVNYPDVYTAHLQRHTSTGSKEVFDFFETSIPDGREEPENKTVILKSECSIFPDSDYSLSILKNGSEILNADTRSVGVIEVLDPLPVPGRELTLTPIQGYLLRWAPVNNARVYQAVVYLNYLESFNQEINQLKLRIPLSTNINSEQIHNITQLLSGSHFYHAIANGLIQKPGLRRKALNLDFQIFAGGEDLSIYVGQEINGMDDFGKTRSFTSFENGEGIFSSRSSVMIKNIELSYISHDSLAESILTRNLGFINHNEEL